MNILDLENSILNIEQYNKYYSDYHVASPYLLYDYMKIFGGGVSGLNVAVEVTSNGIILLPFYIKNAEIDPKYKCVITPYGYTGPFYSDNVTEDEINKFWYDIDDYYKENNIITEFIRFNLDGNRRNYNGVLHETIKNIQGKIINEEDQNKAYDRKVRKNFKKALRENLTINIYEDEINDKVIDEFYHIYSSTMDRNHANDFYRYKKDDFKYFVSRNKKSRVIATVYYNEEAISTELILIDIKNLYSFLGGTISDYFDKRPNDFLKVSVINWAREKGYSQYVLGGGYKQEDGIYEYKKSFFPNDTTIFYTGRKILNEEIYDLLCEKRRQFLEAYSSPKLQDNNSTYFPLFNDL